MNWLWIVVVVILAACLLDGRRRGLVKTVFSLFSAILALALTAVLAPSVSGWLQKNEKLCAYVEDKVESALGAALEEKKEESTAVQIGKIEELPLPGAIREKLIANKNTEVYQALGVSSLKDYVTRYVTGVVINAGAFVAVFVVVNILLIVLANVLNIISKLPVLNMLNKTGGALAGLLQGLIIIWVLCIVLTIFSSTEFAAEIYIQINESRLLSFLYDNNLLLKVVADVVGLLG